MEENDKRLSYDTIFAIINNLNLSKFCLKQSFELVFMIPEASKDIPFPDILKQTTISYDQGNVKFIGIEELKKFLETDWDNLRNRDINFPMYLVPMVKMICYEMNDLLGSVEANLKLTAYAIKLLIIEKMYEEYKKEVIRIQRREHLEQELLQLSKSSAALKKNLAKQNKSEKSTKNRIFREPDTNLEVLDDYTKFPILEDKSFLIQDSSIMQKVNFYIITDFFNVQILKELISIGLPINVVIELSGYKISDPVESINFSAEIEQFWDDLNNYFYSHNRLAVFQKTFLMKHNIANSDSKSILRDFLNVLYRIVDIKLNHYQYLRNLSVRKIPKAKRLPIDCLKIYNHLLKDIPSELFTNNEGIILDSLVNEVCHHFGEYYCPKEETKNVFIEAKETDEKCPNFGINEQFADRRLKSKKEVNDVYSAKVIKKRFPGLENIVHTFVANKRDKLSLILHCYKKLGNQFYDNMINMMAIGIPVLKNTIFSCEINDDGIKHIHNRCQSIDSIKPPPIVYENEEEEEVYDDNVMLVNSTYRNELINHFIHMFLLAIFKRENPNFFKMGNDNEIMNHLKTFPIKNYAEESIKVEANIEKPVEDDSELEKRRKVDFIVHDVNYYNSFPLFYMWKENFNSKVLLQELFSVRKRFLYCDKIYSPCTQKLLLAYHDNLNEYGCHAKTYYELIKHPLCLRDFCYFALSQMEYDLRDWTLNARIDSDERLDKEVCPGLSNVLKNPFYQEYFYLLDVEQVDLPKKSQTSLEEINYLNDLKEYNENKNLCKIYGSSGTNMCFDMKTNDLIYLFGKKTIFSSFDNIRLSVDNTRFAFENPKCTATILLHNNHQLTLHSSEQMSKEPYYFHFNLEDGTIVVFNHKIQTTPKSLSDNLHFGLHTDIKNDEILNKGVEITDKNDVKVAAVDVDTFLKSNSNLSVDEIVIQEDKEKLLETLLLSTDIYKINPKFKYLKPKVQITIPLPILMRRLISKNKISKQPSQKFEFWSQDKEFYDYCPKHNLDFTITYPSSLQVTSILSQTTSNCLEIKQKYLIKDARLSKIENEDYRIFTRGGQCVIKYLDGSISFLHSNGDIIKFQRPSFPIRGSKTVCRKIDLNYYRKTLNNIFQSKQNRRKSPNCSSRRTGFSSIKRIIPEDFKSTLKSYNLPYEKINILKFDGNRIRSDFNKLSCKKKYYSHLERDFNPFQLIYIRSDGFKNYKNEFGLYQVEFPDSTRIVTEVSEAEETVCGFVFVTISYTFLHPFYATVTYEFNGTMKVYLNEDMMIFCEELTTFKLRIDHDISANITRDVVSVHQSCPDCETSCRCKIFTQNFSMNQWKPKDTFIKITDSYNKVFTCNFIGECTRNQTYLTSLKNIKKCCHYLKTNYKKIFVIDSNLSGEMLLTDDYIDQKKEQFLRDKASYIEDGSDEKGGYFMTFGRYIYKTYCSRYFNIDLLNSHICLQRNLNRKEKYKSDPKSVCYKTTSIFFQVMDSEELMSFIYYMKVFRRRMDQLEGDKKDFLQNAVQKFYKDITAYKKYFMQSKYLSGSISVSASNRSKSLPTDANAKVCHCEKTTYSVYEKMAKWKEEYVRAAQKLKNIQVPKYFDSPYFYRFYTSE